MCVRECVCVREREREREEREGGMDREKPDLAENPWLPQASSPSRAGLTPGYKYTCTCICMYTHTHTHTHTCVLVQVSHLELQLEEARSGSSEGAPMCNVMLYLCVCVCICVHTPTPARPPTHPSTHPSQTCKHNHSPAPLRHTRVPHMQYFLSTLHHLLHTHTHTHTHSLTHSHTPDDAEAAPGIQHACSGKAQARGDKPSPCVEVEMAASTVSEFLKSQFHGSPYMVNVH